MGKQPKKRERLGFERETVRNLSDNEMSLINGGYITKTNDCSTPLHIILRTVDKCDTNLLPCSV